MAVKDLSGEYKTIESVEDLEVFKKAHRLTVNIYQLTKTFPVEERFNLVSQMKRAATSIGSNLMEGSYRSNRKEFRHYVGIAKGSAGELKYHLLLARDLGFLVTEDYNLMRDLTDEISKMLHGLIRSLTHD